MEEQDNIKERYFSDDMLRRLLAVEGKTLKGITYYMWYNIANPNAPVELIDNVELAFEDQSAIVISCNEECTSLEIVTDFNYTQEQAILEQQFEGKIKIVPVDAAKTELWKDVPGLVLESIELSKEGEHYLGDAILLNFGEERRTIHLSPLDGLVVDYYEEV